MLLLCGALLLVRTVSNLQGARSGFDGAAVTFWVNPPASRYADAEGPAVVERMLTRIRQVPGVIEAAVNRCTPYGSSCARTVLFMPGRPKRRSHAPVVGRHYVSAYYFHALGIALKRGRLLTDDDRAGRTAVTVINETAARRFWPGEDPIGKRVWFSAKRLHRCGAAARGGRRRGGREVLADRRRDRAGLLHVVPAVHISLVAVRHQDRRPATVLPAIRRAVAEVDPTLPIYDVQLVDERVAEAVARPRFTATVTAMFAISAAVLAALGVFGVMAYSVSVRREELALRLALGETPRGLQLRVLPQAAELASAGVPPDCSPDSGCCGRSAAPSTASRRPIRRPRDRGVGDGRVALVAAAAPAWRASVTDPMIVLRRS